MELIIKTLLQEWKERKLPEVIERDISLDEYLSLKVNKIIVVTGFRRVGKTYLMLGLTEKELKNKSREEIVYLNFEYERIPLSTEFLTMLMPAIRQTYDKETKILLL